MKMNKQSKERIWHAAEMVCLTLKFDLLEMVREWPCYKAGETEHVLALLDPRDRDNLLRSFGRYLMERKVEFTSND